MQPQFTKFHGLGNDYLVFEAEQLNDIEDLGDFARRICNRHYGAGGDGIAIIGKAEERRQPISVAAFSIPMVVKPDFPAMALVAQLRIFTTKASGPGTNCCSARGPD